MVESARSVETTARWCSVAARTATSSRLVMPGPWHAELVATMERLGAEGSDSSQSGKRLPVLTEPSRSGGLPGGVHRHRQERPHELLPLVPLQAVGAFPRWAR